MTAHAPASTHDEVEVPRLSLRGTHITLYVAVVGAVNLLLWWTAEGTPPMRVVGASVMLWLASYPTLLFLSRDKPDRRVPYFPLVNFLYFLYFGLPAFWPDVRLNIGLSYFSEATFSVFLVAGGLVMLQAAFYLPIGKPVDMLPRFESKIDLQNMAWWCLIVGAATTVLPFAVIYGLVPRAVEAVVASLSVLPVALLCGLLLLHLRGNLRPLLQVLSALLFLLFVLAILAQGQLNRLVIIMLPMLFTFWVARGRLPLRALFAIVLALIILQNAKSEFRARTWGNENLSIFERTATYFEVAYDTFSGQDMNVVDASRKAHRRINYVGIMSHVVATTGSRVPYWEGETYKNVLWGFVPRFIAPDKPTVGLGQVFGHRYGILHHSDRTTSLNTPQIVEMYANFGVLGVLFGMFLVGLYYRVLYRLLNHRAGGDGIVLVAAVTFTHLWNIESDASLVLVGTPKVAVMMLVSLWLIDKLAKHVVVFDESAYADAN